MWAPDAAQPPLNADVEDCELYLGEKMITRASLAKLAPHSRVFQCILATQNQPCNVILHPDRISTAALQSVLEFADSGGRVVTLSPDRLADVLQAANHLQMSQLRNIAEKHLVEKTAHTPVLDKILLTQNAPLRPTTRNALLQQLAQQYQSIKDQDQWLSINVNNFCDLISHEHLDNNNNELEVLQSALRWLSRDKSREGDAAKVLSCVRFGNMPDEMLQQAVDLIKQKGYAAHLHSKVTKKAQIKDQKKSETIMPKETVSNMLLEMTKAFNSELKVKSSTTIQTQISVSVDSITHDPFVEETPIQSAVKISWQPASNLKVNIPYSSEERIKKSSSPNDSTETEYEEIPKKRQPKEMQQNRNLKSKDKQESKSSKVNTFVRKADSNTINRQKWQQISPLVEPAHHLITQQEAGKRNALVIRKWTGYTVHKAPATESVSN